MVVAGAGVVAGAAVVVGVWVVSTCVVDVVRALVVLVAGLWWVAEAFLCFVGLFFLAGAVVVVEVVLVSATAVVLVCDTTA